MNEGTQTPESTSPDMPVTEQEGGNPANREAAKYRKRLREVEAERDNLQTQINDAATKHETDMKAASEASEKLRRVILSHNLPHNLDMDLVDGFGIKVNDIVDSEGNVNVEELNNALAPLLRAVHKTSGTPVPNAGKMPDRNRGGLTWENAFSDHTKGPWYDDPSRA